MQVVILRKFLDPVESQRHPSSFYAQSPAFQEAASNRDFIRYFMHGFFLPYEAGFSPLTLSLATYDDFKQACRHYSTITSFLQAAWSKLLDFLTKEASD
jgi:hypothetical protein